MREYVPHALAVNTGVGALCLGFLLMAVILSKPLIMAALFVLLLVIIGARIGIWRYVAYCQAKDREAQRDAAYQVAREKLSQTTTSFFSDQA